MDSKICAGACGLMKPLTAFQADRRIKRDARHAACKECEKARRQSTRETMNRAVAGLSSIDETERPEILGPGYDGDAPFSDDPYADY